MLALVDSNILIYSLTDFSPKQKASQRFIKLNRAILFVSHQNVLESIRVLTHTKFRNPMDAKRAMKSVWSVASSLKLISPNRDTIYLTKELIKKYSIKSNRVFDAYLVATALSNSVNIIATDNTKHFKIYDEIKLLNPYK